MAGGARAGGVLRRRSRRTPPGRRGAARRRPTPRSRTRPGHQLVVAGVVDGVQLALHPGQRPVEHRRARAAHVPGHAGELVAAGDREGPAERLLGVGEDVDAEGAGLGDPRPAGRRLRRGQRHHRGVEGQRGERLAGEAHRRPVLHGRDHGHPGGEVPQHLPEAGLVDADGPGARRSGVVGHGHARRAVGPLSHAAEVDGHALARPPRRPSGAWRPVEPAGPASRWSTSRSECDGSWWKSSRRWAPASAATRTA